MAAAKAGGVNVWWAGGFGCWGAVGEGEGVEGDTGRNASDATGAVAEVAVGNGGEGGGGVVVGLRSHWAEERRAAPTDERKPRRTGGRG